MGCCWPEGTHSGPIGSCTARLRIWTSPPGTTSPCRTSPSTCGRLSRRHEPDLDLGTILDHLAGVGVFAGEDFAEYGLDAPAIVSLRGWATGWYDDLARRLASDHMDDETLDDSRPAPNISRDPVGARRWESP